MSKAVVLNSQSGDWEGLFVDGTLVDENHKLGEGDGGNPRTYWSRMAGRYGFDVESVETFEVSDEDEETLGDSGNFPSLLNELTGPYRLL